ncbi:Crp/Fnr family transcriptional regulator [Mucilaginibacter aquaedulcis]|jgi:CRP-like cAMP-binding protein|uniref:Crp/Fnr family transcriptional regulator n=1 Tax=Mucilaginibacter aquaedulcis TaxID=1187081 RepID=UPI0025B5AF88|nr:Crp/Fnr family transcriptional regulator [Mucilaginibacter aquaedulcis]MDN3546766.1 Crp/Fnr family transcriptional regulator [Mucilaginibacter aquaedulcis]
MINLNVKMDHKQTIINYAKKHVLLSDEEAIEFAAAFKELKVKKRQFIIQPEFTAKSKYFVLSGSLRSYVVCNEGQDHTIQLAIEEWWISDYNSYIFQQPASMFVVAMEDSLLFQLTHDQENRLTATNHKFETLFRILAEQSVAFMQRRIISNLTHSAEKRYELFMIKYPAMGYRFPQYVIASYLGMTTEFLSKIRNQRVKHKS